MKRRACKWAALVASGGVLIAMSGCWSAIGQLLLSELLPVT